MKKRILPATLAAAGLALAAGPLHAEPNVPYSSGDVILGFQLSGDNDLEVDIGPYSSFLNATTPFNINFGVIPADQTGAGATVTSLNADLTANYGSSWASSALQWGVVGNNGSTIFLSQDAADPDIPQRPSTSNAGVFSGDIESLGDGLGTSPSTINSTKTASVATGAANSWDSFTPSSDGFETGLDIEQQDGHGATTSALNLFELAPNGRNGGGNGQDIGSFALNNSGDLTFTPEAVPEPSTWLSVIAGALLLVFARRRRGFRVH